MHQWPSVKMEDRDARNGQVAPHGPFCQSMLIENLPQFTGLSTLPQLLLWLSVLYWRLLMLLIDGYLLIVFVYFKTKPNTSGLALVPNFQRLTLTPFVLHFLISPHLSMILDLFLSLSSLYLTMSTASLVLVSTAYVKSVSSVNHSLCKVCICYHDFGSCF